MTDNHKLPSRRHSTSLIWIVVAALLVGFVALGLLTHAPGSPLTVILVVASSVVLIGFVVGIVAMELRSHRAERNG
jgi:hypothetical protein